MFKDLWRVLTGELSSKTQTAWRAAHFQSECKVSALSQELFTAKREHPMMLAAIAELKAQLPADWEAQRKAKSDLLGEAAIKKMEAEAKAFLPPKEPA